MRQLMLRLWKDDCGALIATEWIFVATLLVIGIITGLCQVKLAVISELTDIANALLSLNQTYSTCGWSGCCCFTVGSAFVDSCASVVPLVHVPAQCVGSGVESICD